MKKPNSVVSSNEMNQEELDEMIKLVAQIESVSLDLPQEVRGHYLEARDSVIRARIVGSLSTKGSW